METPGLMFATFSGEFWHDDELPERGVPTNAERIRIARNTVSPEYTDASEAER